MNIDIPAKLTKLQWKPILLLSTSVLTVAFFLIQMLPALRKLIMFGLYSIPSHMLISPFPHEPALLYTAKHFSALSISITATIGCCLAGFFDYWLIRPLVHHRSLRPKFENSRLFKKSLKFFKKSPFLLLTLAALSPVPFYPFKFLSIAGNYPIWKYQTSLIVGRAPRFYGLALLGGALQISTWLLITIFVVLLISPFMKKIISMTMALFTGKSAKLEITDAPDEELMLNDYEEFLPIGEKYKRLREYRTVANS